MVLYHDMKNLFCPLRRVSSYASTACCLIPDVGTCDRAYTWNNVSCSAVLTMTRVTIMLIYLIWLTTNLTPDSLSSLSIYLSRHGEVAQIIFHICIYMLCSRYTPTDFSGGLRVDYSIVPLCMDVELYRNLP